MAGVTRGVEGGVKAGVLAGVVAVAAGSAQGQSVDLTWLFEQDDSGFVELVLLAENADEFDAVVVDLGDGEIIPAESEDDGATFEVVLIEEEEGLTFGELGSVLSPTDTLDIRFSQPGLVVSTLRFQIGATLTSLTADDLPPAATALTISGSPAVFSWAPAPAGTFDVLSVEIEEEAAPFGSVSFLSDAGLAAVFGDTGVIAAGTSSLSLAAVSPGPVLGLVSYVNLLPPVASSLVSGPAIGLGVNLAAAANSAEIFGVVPGGGCNAADLDEDGDNDIFDLLVLLAGIDAGDTASDFDFDGEAGASDVFAFLALFDASDPACQ